MYSPASIEIIASEYPNKEPRRKRRGIGPQGLNKTQRRDIEQSA
jgi:hypothetical protein